MIRVIAVGKNNPALREYEADLSKRIGRFARFEMIELKEDKSKTTDQILEKEADKILARIKDKEYVCLLDISGGKSLDSVAFSDMIKNKDDIVFIIGGAFGVSGKVRKRADALLSFSSMTFNHQLFRMMLLEQIYRGLSIIKGHKYHK